ncbi:MAG: hypothetical protein AB8G99_18380 [Planctomycetaceae bacterium]
MANRLIRVKIGFRNTVLGYAEGVAVAYVLVALSSMQENAQYGFVRFTNWGLIPGPAIIGTLFGSAAFATYLPANRNLYLSSLGIVTLLSVFAWTVLRDLKIIPNHLKIYINPDMAPSELVVWLAPPAITGMLLCIFRIMQMHVTLTEQNGTDST